MDTELVLNLRNGDQHKMSVETFAKWLCLMEAMEFMNNSPRAKGFDFDKNKKWIKPIEFQKYLDSRFPAMLHDLKIEEYLDF